MISGAPIAFFDMQTHYYEEEKKGSGDDFVESKNDNFNIKADSMSTLRFVDVYNSQSVEVSPSGKTDVLYINSSHFNYISLIC